MNTNWSARSVMFLERFEKNLRDYRLAMNPGCFVATEQGEASLSAGSKSVGLSDRLQRASTSCDVGLEARGPLRQNNGSTRIDKSSGLPVALVMTLAAR